MKRITTSVLFTLISVILFSQNVKKIENLKDAWDLTYSYTGEVKDGKPNGMGVAKYPSGNVLRYVGSFVNGMYNGKGTMFFGDGAFLTGEWRNGKLNGRGTNLTANGALYIGEFANGVKNGKGTIFNKDNSVVIGRFEDDKMNGRCINIWADGSIISDIHYSDDKRNGLGFQYEAKPKTLYQGEWRDDKWVQAATPSFGSFLTATKFIGESTDDHILMGPTNSSNYLIDSSYYYDIKKGKRYFGIYENGHLRNGLIMGDSTRFLGPLNDNGASGYSYDFKFKKYYSEGNYTNDYLNGQILDIDLEKKTAYYGGAVDGAFTGRTYFFNGSGTMYYGDYIKGRLNGNGYRLETSGRLTVGAWQDGVVKTLTSVTTAKGETISGTQKTLAEGINTAIKAYPGSFDDIYGEGVLDDDVLADLETIDPDAALTYTYSLVNIPGSIGKNIVCEDFDENTFYLATFLKTNDAAKAKAKYNDLAKQLQTVPVSNAYITGKLKLTGTVTPPVTGEDKTVTEFSLSAEDDDYDSFHVWLRLRKNGTDYFVEVIIGAKTDDY